MCKGIKEEDIYKKIELCKYCEKPEYMGEFRWLNGRKLCRSCYKHEYQITYRKRYVWDDLDGDRPTDKDYYDQVDNK